MLSLYQLTTLLAISIGLANCQGPTETDKATSTSSSPRSTASTKTKSPADIVNDMKYEDSTGQQFFDDAGGNDTGAKSSDVVVPPKEKEVIVCPDKYARTCETDGWSLKCKNKDHSPFAGKCPRVFHNKVVKSMTTHTTGSEQNEVIESHVITILTTTTETSSPGFIASLVVTDTTTVTTDAKGVSTTSKESSSSSSMSTTYTTHESNNYKNGVKVSKKGQFEEIGDVAGSLGA